MTRGVKYDTKKAFATYRDTLAVSAIFIKTKSTFKVNSLKIRYNAILISFQRLVMIKLCVFDFDSTLMDGETIDILANAFNVGDEVKNITQKAMNGELDFFESLNQRAALLKGMSVEKVEQICENLPLMQGAVELLTHLKSKNIQIVVFSGGFHEGIDKAQKKLGFDIGFANFLHQKDGFLTGKVGGEMMFNNSKGIMLARLKHFLNLAQNEVACVGDGANDIAMFKEAGLKIAFCAKPVLKSYADICVDDKDLKLLIKDFQ